MKNYYLINSALMLLFFNGVTAQTTLNDWDVIDPWESTCQSTEMTREEGQLYTNVASKAFTWLTGTREQAEYEPIGELANYFGFAKLRNEIRDASNDPLADEQLRGTSWIVVLENLNSEQRQIMYDASLAQETYFSDFLDERVDLIGMLYGLKEDQQLNLSGALTHIEAMGTNEAQISIISAEGFGEISLTLNATQKALFENIRLGNLFVSNLKGTGPYVAEVDNEMRAFTDFQKELITETASKFLSYETGSLEDAIYLPAGKIGNFFGFAQYRYEERADVSRSQAADLLISVLTDEQEDILKCLTLQVFNFEQNYVDARAGLITDIHPFLTGGNVNETSALNDYVFGATDEGKMGVVQAIYFDFLERLLTANQIEELKTLRENTGEGGTLDVVTYELSNTTEALSLVTYPNPVEDFLNIKAEENYWDTSNLSFILYDLTGKELQVLKNSEITLGLSMEGYSQGMYLLEVSDGKRKYSKRIIKQ